QQAGDRVYEPAVDLLGHEVIRGPQPGLDVDDRNAELRRGERARQGRVGVADHDRGPRPMLLEPLLAGNEERGRLAGVSAGPHVEERVRGAHAELIVVHLVERVVIVLAGIHGDDRADGAERVAQHARLDHLRASAEEQRDRRWAAHAITRDRTTGWRRPRGRPAPRSAPGTWGGS